MDGIYKRIVIFMLVIFLGFSPAFASNENLKIIADMNSDFSIENGIPEEFHFVTNEKTVIDNETVIPRHAAVTLEIMQAQKERRWHKSGFLVCKLKSYTQENSHSVVDLSSKDIYLVIRKYEPLNKKEASVTATEIVLTQAVSLFAPGVDILYYFTKGAIQREKNPNWFKAGVYNAYDNSVFWFWLKGKPIDLKSDDQIQVKEVDAARAGELKEQIDVRQEKQHYKDAKSKTDFAYSEQKKTAQSEYKNKKEQLKQQYDDSGQNSETPEDISENTDVQASFKAEKKQLKSDYKNQLEQIKENKEQKINEIKSNHRKYKQHRKELKNNKDGSSAKSEI